MSPITISKITARRFVLGKQGLWPGRRWQGLEGTASAMHSMQALQLDPLTIVARSQDITLFGRVLDYSPDDWQQCAYQQRQFFDYGGWLAVYPMSELPYWRLHMQRRQTDQRWLDLQTNHPEALTFVKQALEESGPLGNRDFKGINRVNSYRGRKDTALALFWLWLTGELMIHRRAGFERVYDLRSRIAPPELDYIAPQDETERHFARKAVAFYGLLRQKRWPTEISGSIHRKVSAAEAHGWQAEMTAAGELAVVNVEGSPEPWLVLGEDLPRLIEIEAGHVPAEWQPLGPSTLDEVTLLAPLDIVSARGRAAQLFDFDYIWEVYKPLHQRRWGYYTLPILYGDRLVARLDPRLDRRSHTLHILGFWTEEHAPLEDAAFIHALGLGLARFAAFTGARRVETAALQPSNLRQQVNAVLAQSLEVVSL